MIGALAALHAQTARRYAIDKVLYDVAAGTLVEPALLTVIDVLIKRVELRDEVVVKVVVVEDGDEGAE